MYPSSTPFPVLVCRGAAAYPHCHRAWGGVDTGQVVSQGQQTNEQKLCARQFLGNMQFLPLRVESLLSGFGLDGAWLAVSPSISFLFFFVL